MYKMKWRSLLLKLHKTCWTNFRGSRSSLPQLVECPRTISGNRNQSQCVWTGSEELMYNEVNESISISWSRGATWARTGHHHHHCCCAWFLQRLFWAFFNHWMSVWVESEPSTRSWVECDHKLCRSRAFVIRQLSHSPVTQESSVSRLIGAGCQE